MLFGLPQLSIALLRRHPEDLGLRPDGMARPPDGTVSKAAAPGALFREATRSPAFWTLTAAFALGLCAHSVILLHQVRT